MPAVSATDGLRYCAEATEPHPRQSAIARLRPNADRGELMRAYVGVTDRDWYRLLLADGPHHDEVNFWFPSANMGFQALSPGQPFVFKTHVERNHPEISNRLVGVGLFSGFGRSTIKEAWELLGHANGVDSLESLRMRIEHYARRPITRFEDPLIGCVLLQNVVFFKES